MSEEIIRGSHEKIGKLTPITYDAFGNIIDGFNRVKVDPKWKEFSVKLDHIDTPIKLAIARFSANNDRRIIDAEERTKRLRGIHDATGWDLKQCAEELGKAPSTLYPYWPEELKDKQMQALRKGKKAPLRSSITTKEDQLQRNVCKEFGLSQGELTPGQIQRYLKMKHLDQQRMLQSFRDNLSNGNKLLPKQLFKKVEKKLAVIVLVNKRRVVPHATESAESSSLGSLSPPKAVVNPNTLPSADLILQVPQRLEEKPLGSAVETFKDKSHPEKLTLEERFVSVPFTWKQWKPTEVRDGVVDPSRFKHSQFPKECICAHCPAILKCQFGIKPSKSVES